MGVIEQDALNNGPLATVIVPRGTLQEGSQILEVELRVVGGDTQQVNVLGGQLVRLPLPRGKRAAVRIRPAQGIYIGNNPPGAEVLSDEAAISGSALGVVIDARPRPLRLPDEQDERSRTLLAWLRALDAIPPVSAPPPAAIPQAAVAPTTPTPASTTEANGETSLLEDEDRSATEAPASPSVISAAVVDQDRADTGSDPNMDPRALDLQAMRADLVEPAKPRRGFFRRRS